MEGGINRNGSTGTAHFGSEESTEGSEGDCKQVITFVTCVSFQRFTEPNHYYNSSSYIQLIWQSLKEPLQHGCKTATMKPESTLHNTLQH